MSRALIRLEGVLLGVAMLLNLAAPRAGGGRPGLGGGVRIRPAQLSIPRSTACNAPNSGPRC